MFILGLRLLLNKCCYRSYSINAFLPPGLIPVLSFRIFPCVCTLYRLTSQQRICWTGLPSGSLPSLLWDLGYFQFVLGSIWPISSSTLLSASVPELLARPVKVPTSSNSCLSLASSICTASTGHCSRSTAGPVSSHCFILVKIPGTSCFTISLSSSTCECKRTLISTTNLHCVLPLFGSLVQSVYSKLYQLCFLLLCLTVCYHALVEHLRWPFCHW